MSSKIDQRIVEMSFENHKFEKGINQSKGSLKEFSNALKGMGTGKDFDGLENSVSSLSSSFSLLEQISIGALRRIGEMAVNAGVSLAKSLSMDQLSAGLTKYQEKIEAVQTMVSAGYDFDEVERSMAQIMWFSDETSYSFQDMAGNMAKFIAAGVDLPVAERAMQGIATWAAHSGKDSNAASIAMFNLSQAISMGYVDTLNWRSIMNQNMNTVMFKEIAIGVAEATGAIKEGQVTIQNFDSNLRDKWFTNDVLLQTLEQYSMYAEKVREVQEEMNFDTAVEAMDYMDEHADKYADVLATIGNAAFKASQESKSFKDSIEATKDAVSTGWLQTYEIIFGTLYEAKENFSQLTEILWTVFASGAAVRNEMLKAVKDAGGIKNAFQVLKNVAMALLTPLKAVSQGFDDVFPPKTAENWVHILEVLEDFTSQLIITDESADKIRRTFAGVFAVLDMGWMTVKFLGSALLSIVQTFVPMTGGVLDFTASIGDYLVALNRAIKSTDIFQYGLLGVKVTSLIIRNALIMVINTISEFANKLWNADKPIEYIGSLILDVFGNVIEIIKMGIGWLSGGFVDVLKTVSAAIDKALGEETNNTLKTILEVLKDFVDLIIDRATGGLKNFGDVIKDLDFNKIATFATGGVLLLFVSQLTSLTSAMTGLMNVTSGFVTKFSRRMFGTQTKIKDLAITFGIVALSLYALSDIPWEDLKRGLTGLAGAIGIFVAAYAGIQTVNVIATKLLGDKEMIKSAFNLVGIASGLAVMAGALKIISSIDNTGISKSVVVLGGLMAFLIAYQALYAVISTIPGQGKLSVNLLGVTTGLLGLIGALKLLDGITNSQLNNGLTKLATILLVIGGIQGVFALAARATQGHKLTTNVLGIAAGIAALIGVLKLLSVIDTTGLSKSIGNLFLLGGVLAGIQVMFGLAGRLSGGAKFKTNMLSVQLGLLAMVGLIAVLGVMDPVKVDMGVMTLMKMAGIIGAIEVLTGLSARIGGGNKTQKVLSSVTFTMLSFTGLIALLGGMEQSTIDKGLMTITKMAGIIVAIGALSALSAKISGDVRTFSSMVGVVTAILTLTASMALLSMIDQEALRQATISLAIGATAVGGMAVGIGVMTQAMALMSGNLAKITGLVQGLKAGLAVLGIVLGSTLVLVGTIKMVSPLLDSIEWDSFGKFAAGLGLMGGALAAMALLAPSLMVLGTGFSSALGGVLTAITGVTMVVLGFSGLSILMDKLFASDSLVKGMDKLIIVGEGLGRFVGAAIGGIGSEILVQTGKGLAEFSKSMGEIDSSSFEGVQNLALAMLTLTGSSLLDGLSRLVNLGKNPGEVFGEQIQGLVEAFKDLSISDVKLTSDILAILGPMADNLKDFANAAKNIPNSGGFLGAFLGNNDIDDFGEDVSLFIESLSTMPLTKVKHTSLVLGLLAPMADNLKTFAKSADAIPNTGGFLGAFLGNNDVDKFGTMLNKFVTNISGIKESNVKTADATFVAMKPMIENLKTFAGTAQNIPSSGGLKQLFTGNSTLSNFAGELIKFVDKLKGADFTVVEPALASLEQITESFKVVGADVLTNAKKSFDNNQEPFQKSITSILDKAIKTINTKKAVMVKDTTSIFTTVLSRSKGYVKDFKDLGSDLIISLRDGIESERVTTTNTMASVADSVVRTAKNVFKSGSPSKVFTEIGRWLPISLGSGISNETKSATTAATGMAQDVENAVRDGLQVYSLSDLFSVIGDYVPLSLTNGLERTKGKLLESAENLGVNTSNVTLGGLKDAFEGEAGSLTTMFADLMDLLSSSPGVTTATEALGLSIGDDITENMQAALGDSSTGIGGSKTQAVVKSQLEKLQSLLEEEKFYGRLSLEEELESYETLRLVAGQSAEDRKKIDREIYRLVKEIYESQISYIEEVAKLEEDSAQQRKKLADDYLADMDKTRSDANTKLADLESKYNKDVISARENAQVKINQAEKNYQTEYNQILDKAEQDRHKLREDYANNQKSINQKLLSDIDAQNQAYETAVASRANTIYGAYSLFAAVEEDAEVFGEDLLKNLKDQGVALAEWEDSLNALSARGISDTLLVELQEMGPTSKAQIKALLSLTDEQLNEYVELFEGKYSFARTRAEKELEQLKQSTTTIIQELNAQAALDLTTLEEQFNLSMSNVNIQMSEDFKVLKTTYKETLEEIKMELDEQLFELKTSFDVSSKEITNNMDAELARLKATYHESLNTINTDTDAQLLTLKTQYETAMKSIKELSESEFKELIEDNKLKLEELNKETEVLLSGIEYTYDASGNRIVTNFDEDMKDLQEDTNENLTVLHGNISDILLTIEERFEEAGYNSAEGFARGIRERMVVVLAAVNAMASNATGEAEEELEVESPSKVFKRIGQFVAMGFANGMREFTWMVNETARDLGEGPLSVISSIMSDVESGLEDELDFEPVITPVIDLSGVRSGSKRLNRLLGSDLSLSETASKSSSIIAKTIPITNDDIPRGKGPKASPSYSFVQNNYSPKALSRSEIYRQTKNQFSTLKGLVSEQ